MTTKGFWTQDEGCRAEGFPASVLTPEHWNAHPLWPAQCVRVEVVVHRLPDHSVACWAYEVSNPHTQELLSKHVQPYVTPSEGRGLPADVAEALEVALVALLDPDPF